MERPLLSSNWYRVAGLRPRLRSHVRLHRHAYRGEVWYVLEDRVGGRHHRFNLAYHRALHLMDGRRTLAQVWALLTAELREDSPTQEELIQLLGQLHGADLVQCDVTPDVAELFERRGRQQRQKWFGRVGNPVGIKLPLFDPDRLLTWLHARLRPLANARGIALWLAVVLPAVVLAVVHGRELTGDAAERLLAADNLLLLAVLFPLVKAAHELGHGLACKHFGGEVHEAGLMLLALYPVPYVDVSNAAACPGKWGRALVGAAGMLTELFIAAVAFYLWLALEPGLARAMAYDVALLASVTTLFFNANPLLRYDGYYILADVVEIPNLGQRANRQWQHWVERHVFGVRGAEPPPATPGERRWFFWYGPLSFVYRLVVSLSIAVFVAGRFFLVGVVMALWTLVLSVLWPAFKGLRALATGPQFADRTTRVRSVMAGTAIVLALLLFALPLPRHTLAEGVLWLPEKAILRAGSAGFVRQVLVAPGSVVQPGQAVIEAVDATLAAQMEAQAAKVEEAQGHYDAAWGVQQARAEQLVEELRREQGVAARLEEQAAQLTVRAEVGGLLLIAAADDLPGRHVRKGEVLGQVRTGEPPLVRVVVPQAEVDAVRLDTRAVEVRLATHGAQVWPASMVRGVPGAVRQLPSAVLGSRGGGEAVLDPRDDKGLTTLESLFEFELRLPDGVPDHYLGSRVHVRFTHAAEPVGWRGLRALRRAFLSHFQW